MADEGSLSHVSLRAGRELKKSSERVDRVLEGAAYIVEFTVHEAKLLNFSRHRTYTPGRRVL
eukprot:1358313-Amorphochlora_amoeboformis.AAC.1